MLVVSVFLSALQRQYRLGYASGRRLGVVGDLSLYRAISRTTFYLFIIDLAIIQILTRFIIVLVLLLVDRADNW